MTDQTDQPTTDTDDDAPVMVTYTVHKADRDGTRETSWRFITTVAIDESQGYYWRLHRTALEAALSNGTVTDPGDYLVTALPPNDDEYRRDEFTGRVLTVTTTPRIEGE